MPGKGMGSLPSATGSDASGGGSGTNPALDGSPSGTDAASGGTTGGSTQDAGSAPGVGGGGLNIPVISVPRPRPGEGGPASVDDLPVGDPCADVSIGPDQVTVEGYPQAIWLPGGIKTIRCIIGVGGVNDMARLNNCAVLRFPGETPTGEKSPRITHTMEALKQFAALTGHPELEHLQILGWGYSYTAGQRTSQMRAMPERFMAMATGGIGGDRPMAPLEGIIPWLSIDGSTDGGASNPSKWQNLVREVRGAGYFYGKAMRWGKFHEVGDSKQIQVPFFHQVIALRAPKPGQPVTELRSVKLSPESGWLVGVDDWDTPYPQVASWKDWKGDRARASWMPDAFTAHVLRAYAAKSPLRLTDPPCKGDLCVPRSVGVKSEVPVALEVSGEAPVKVDLWDGDRKLFPLPGPPYAVRVTDLTPGVHAFYAEATYADGRKAVSNPRSVIVNKPGSTCNRPASADAGTATEQDAGVAEGP
jgi:hypothetical protein